MNWPLMKSLVNLISGNFTVVAPLHLPFSIYFSLYFSLSLSFSMLVEGQRGYLRIYIEVSRFTRQQRQWIFLLSS